MSSPPTGRLPEPESERDRRFTEFVYAYDSQVKAHLRRSFPALRDVEDVVQESYLRIWRLWAVRPINSARGLLFTVARRLALNLMRRDRRAPMSAGPGVDVRLVAGGQLSASESAVIAEDLDRLVAAIESLPARCREIFVLRRIQGVPQKEIAARLGLSEQTVQVQAARGLRKVEAFLRRPAEPAE